MTPETLTSAVKKSVVVGGIVNHGIGFAVGSWLDLDCDWRHRHVYHGGWYHKHHHHHTPSHRYHGPHDHSAERMLAHAAAAEYRMK